MFLRNISRIERYGNSINNFHIIQPSSLIIRKIACWKCGKNHEGGTECVNCHAIQDPKKIDYFALLGQKNSFDVDSKSLISNYHNLQIRFHPDKHSNDEEVGKIRHFQQGSWSNCIGLRLVTFSSPKIKNSLAPNFL